MIGLDVLVMAALAGEPEAVIVVVDPKGRLEFAVDGVPATETVGPAQRFHVAPGLHTVTVLRRGELLGTFPVEVGPRRERRCRWERDTPICYADVDLDARAEVPAPVVAAESSSGAAFGWGLYGGGVVPGGIVVSGTSGGDSHVGSGTLAVRFVGGDPVEVLVGGQVVATSAAAGVLSVAVPSGVQQVAFRRLGETAPYASGRLTVPGGAVVTLLAEGRAAPRVGEGVPESSWVVETP